MICELIYWTFEFNIHCADTLSSIFLAQIHYRIMVWVFRHDVAYGLQFQLIKIMNIKILANWAGKYNRSKKTESSHERNRCRKTNHVLKRSIDFVAKYFNAIRLLNFCKNWNLRKVFEGELVTARVRCRYFHKTGEWSISELFHHSLRTVPPWYCGPAQPALQQTLRKLVLTQHCQASWNQVLSLWQLF